MRLSWEQALRPVTALPAAVLVRQLTTTDEAAIGRLMWAAFRGTVDDQYAGPADARLDAAQTVAGRWGPVVWDASLAAQLDSVVIAAAIVVRDSAHDGLPLLAFALTDPSHQRRGIGQRLIEEYRAPEFEWRSRIASCGHPGQPGCPALSAARLRRRGVTDRPPCCRIQAKSVRRRRLRLPYSPSAQRARCGAVCAACPQHE